MCSLWGRRRLLNEIKSENDTGTIHTMGPGDGGTQDIETKKKDREEKEQRVASL